MSMFKWDLADVAEGVCVVIEIHQHDMCEDMSAIANWVLGGDVENRFDAECVPYSSWELHMVARRYRSVRANRDGRPIEVPVVGSGEYRRGNAHSIWNGEEAAGGCPRMGWLLSGSHKELGL